MERLRGLRNFAIVALVALAIALAPGGGTGLSVAMWVATIVFAVVIALSLYRAYLENRFAIESLSQTERGVAWGSCGLALLDFAAAPRLFATGGGGVVVWLAILALCSYGLFWVWRHSREYG